MKAVGALASYDFHRPEFRVRVRLHFVVYCLAKKIPHYY